MPEPIDFIFIVDGLKLPVYQDARLARLSALVRQLQFVKTENEVLRAHLPERVVVTPRERRRLIRLGKPLGSAIKDLITIVTPATFLRWLREAKAGKEQARPAGADG
jgi:putative transposase